MSARRGRRLVIKPAAKLDIDDALLFTRERWGIEQRRHYRDTLRRVMRSLLDYPEQGRSRPELGAEVRSIAVEQHVIVYAVTETEIMIGPGGTSVPGRHPQCRRRIAHLIDSIT